MNREDGIVAQVTARLLGNRTRYTLLEGHAKGLESICAVCASKLSEHSASMSYCPPYPEELSSYEELERMIDEAQKELDRPKRTGSREKQGSPHQGAD